MSGRLPPADDVSVSGGLLSKTARPLSLTGGQGRRAGTESSEQASLSGVGG